MASSFLHAGLRHRLIQQLAAKRRHPHPAGSQGFTLIELLVVVIIIAILSAVALPGFLNQSEKAKASAAKALVASAAKECQTMKVEGIFGAISTQSSKEVTLTEDVPCGTATGKWTASVVGSNPPKTFTTEATELQVLKTCSSTIGCDNGTW